MSKTFIEDYLNKLEELIKKYKETKVLVEKVKYQEEIQNLLFLYKEIAAKGTKEEIERVRKVVRKAEEIFEEAYGKNSEADMNLKQINNSNVLLWSHDGKFDRKTQNGMTEAEVKREKIENFKYYWIKAHHQMNKKEREEHLKALKKLNKTSIDGVELSEKELLTLKRELIERANKRKVIGNRIEKIEERLKRKIKEIQNNRQNRRIQTEKQALNTYRESLIKKRNNDTLKR